jgi:hypothetical protein
MLALRGDYGDCAEFEDGYVVLFQVHRAESAGPTTNAGISWSAILYTCVIVQAFL